MRKTASVLIILLICIPNSIFSAQHISVSLSHQVYGILEAAELQGIIEPLPRAKPYTKTDIIKNLKVIHTSTSISVEEKRVVESLIKEFTFKPHQTENFNDFILLGAYTSNVETLGSSLSIGIQGEMEFTSSFLEYDGYESRNVGRVYIRGDILDFASFNMDFGFRLDHINASFFLPNDYSVPSEGFYESLYDQGGDHTFYYGLDMHPELSFYFLDGNLLLRWASIKRDLGVGKNNLMLSGSARSFEGIELSAQFAPWLMYNFVTGSLAKFIFTESLNNPANENFFNNYFFSDGQQGTTLDNNFSAHRVEVALPGNLRLGIYESVVYRKRFELAYLNPFSILMFQQNLLGDFDNMLAGVDFQWRLPGVLRLYGTAATTEMNEINPSRFFKAPRNILSMQGGIDFNLPIGQFSKFTFQYTYISPFFYTHYPVNIKDDGLDDYAYELMYVNKGENLGYPLRPNSDEFLISTQFGLKEGIRANLTAKYQRRSGQYGFNMDEYMVYRAASQDYYEDKDFTGYLFEKTFGLTIGVSKTLKEYPVSLYVNYLYNLTTKRNPPKAIAWWDFNANLGAGGVIYGTEPESSDSYHAIQYEVTGPWSSPSHSHAIQLGVSIWR